MIKKVLIIVYYWPPSGGAGVQRWLKLTKYLSKIGVKPFVITVDEKSASYMQIDEKMVDEIHSEVEVIKTKSFEPINIYARIVGKKNVPTAGFSNVNNNNPAQKIINFIRTNLFIPDPRKGWNKYAYSAAKSLIKKEGITHVITSSPPHSSQLIGLKLKKKLGITWIADLRDLWSDLYYYNYIGHTFFSRKIDSNYEKRVLENADQLITVAPIFKEIFLTKTKKKIKDRFHVITNGYDPDDFIALKETKKDNNSFIISYMGTMAKRYKPEIIFSSIIKLKESNPNKNIIFRTVGLIDKSIIEYAKKLGLGENLELIDYKPHHTALNLMKESDALLLVVPEIIDSKGEIAEGILPGKLFEYMALQKPIIHIGLKNGDVANIIEECEAGQSFDRNDEQILIKYISNLLTQNKFSSNIKNIKKHSRLVQAKKIERLIT